MKIEPLGKHRKWIPQLACWHHAQWSDLNPGETLAGRVARLELNATGSELPLTWVAFEDEILFGSASLVNSDMETQPELRPWLASVFVAPEHRRKGIGASLVQHVVNEARERGYESLFLFTPDQQKFYEKLGWRELDQFNYREIQVSLMRIDLELEDSTHFSAEG